MPTAVDHAEAALERLSLADVHALPPAHRRRLAELCFHWFQLCEGRTYRVVETGELADLVAPVGLGNTRPAGSTAGVQAKPPVGVLDRLKRGERSS
jgi:hypothetical protein